jgi:predicted nucleotidyltransferase
VVVKKKVKIIWLVIIISIIIGSTICRISHSVEGLPESFDMFMNEKEFTEEEIESYYPRP